MKYNEREIDKIYKENLTDARRRLALLPVSEGREPNIQGLNGWVYEQTICHCLAEELKTLGLFPLIEEQVTLHRRAKIDLLVGRVAVEIKLAGSFGDDAMKYSEYRAKVEQRGWVYCYLTQSETYKRYRLATAAAFGKERAFFLDTKGDWERFVREVLKSYEEKR
jgi:hypothetical protein